MSLKNLTTKTAEERVESIEKHLRNLQNSANHFLSLYHYCRDAEHEAFSLSLDDIGYFHGIMSMAVDTLSAELGMLKYEGKPHAEAFVLRPQAPAQEGFELDHVTRENLIRDMGKLAGMSPELQLMAEGICNDLGLPLPPAIQERIAREKAARGAAQDPEPAPRKLNHYTPGLANAKISLKAFWGYLEGPGACGG